MTQQDDRYEKWRHFVVTKDPKILSSILAENVVMRSPVFWTPKEGKEATSLILTTAARVFENFTYQRTWTDGRDWVLEFSAEVDGKSLKGVDLIHWNEQGKISEFEVMIRPINALQLLGMKMGERLANSGIF